MTVISQTRSISCTHTRDLVVYDSTLSISRDNVLRISGGAALGKHGNLFRSLRVPFDGVSPTTLQKGMEQHESSVLDLIDMLEGALEWAVKCTVTFNRFPEVAEVGIFNRVLAEESPVMVHGTARGRRLVVTLYGEDLTPFPYELDMRGFERLQTFKVRMEELIEGFRKHLKHLSSIPVDKILSEVKKNLSANSPYPKV